MILSTLRRSLYEVRMFSIVVCALVGLVAFETARNYGRLLVRKRARQLMALRYNIRCGDPVYTGLHKARGLPIWKHETHWGLPTTDFKGLVVSWREMPSFDDRPDDPSLFVQLDVNNKVQWVKLNALGCGWSDGAHAAPEERIQ